MLKSQRIDACGQHLLEPHPQVDVSVIDRVCGSVTGQVQHDASEIRQSAHERRPVGDTVTEAMQKQTGSPPPTSTARSRTRGCASESARTDGESA